MSKIRRELIVKPGTRVRLPEIDAGATPGASGKPEATVQFEKNLARLAELQYLLYAENKRALLVVFQAMDAGGKDGAIRHVMSGLNPQGCQVTSFKVPAGEETEHDFLWRIHKAVPPYGDIGVFNRSHYEDVLVVRVHKIVPKAVWSKRFAQINEFEKMLAESGTTILKFFLHISPDEQKERLQARIQDPTKNWKIAPADFAERKYWDDYMAAYEDALSECSTASAPWFIVPADRKWYRNLAVSQIMMETLEDMKLELPKPVMDLSAVSFD